MQEATSISSATRVVPMLALAQTAQRRAYPACFETHRQFVAWKQTARRLSPGASDYCADCTPEYQAQMVRCFRCAYPGTTFHNDEDGCLAGVRPEGRPHVRKTHSRKSQSESPRGLQSVFQPVLNS